MKKYAFLLFFTLLWATISPFIAFRFICGSFILEKKAVSESLHEQESSEESSENEYINAESEEESTEISNFSSESEYVPSIVELLTSDMLSKINYQSYSEECQKAIAVALRTQVVFKESKGELNKKSLSLSIESDIPQCVLETEGLILTYNNEPINAIIHKSSYKTTITSSNGEKYLLSVETSEREEDNKTVLTFSKEKFKSIIKELCPDIVFEEEKIIKKLVFNEENRCSSINSGNCAFSAESFAEKLSLPSTAFSIDENSEQLTVTVYGEGSGIGLSLEGAEALSNKGKAFDDILKHYYTGVELENIE
ncbi:MAG: hypothetical protein J6V36_00650 [Clostridia bacterium]|nr:hypothetical protein [Clostridia bacterium]